MRPLDTTEAAWERVERGLRQLTCAERFRRAVSLTVLSHGIALGQIRRAHPGESERQSRLRLAARMTDRALMAAAFGWPDD